MTSSKYTVDGNARGTSQDSGHDFLEAELSPKEIHVQWNTPTCVTNAVRFLLSGWTHKQFLFEAIAAMASNVNWKVGQVIVAILDRCVYKTNIFYYTASICKQIQRGWLEGQAWQETFISGHIK